MVAPAWSDAELAKLERMAGNTPLPLLTKVYNQWARVMGYSLRTQKAILRRGYEIGLSFELVGDWITCEYIAGVLGCHRSRPGEWVEDGLLKAWRTGRGVRRKPYIRREWLREMARSHSEKLAGYGEGPLTVLLEDDELVEWLMGLGQRRPRPTPRKRVRCVDTGRVYPSIKAAAAAVFVTHRAITHAIRRGTRSAGCRWEFMTNCDNHARGGGYGP